MLYMAGNHSTAWALRREGFNIGWLLSPGGERRPVRKSGEVMPYAIDNGLYHPHDQPQKPPEAELGVYELLCKASRLKWPRPLWYVVPDVPYDGKRSLEITMAHAPRMRALFPDIPQAIAVQDGMDFAAAEPFDVVFVAGSTDWKEATLENWSKWSRERGKLCHVARVNTSRRIKLCQDAEIDSADGTAIAHGARKSMAGILRELAQGQLWPLRTAQHPKPSEHPQPPAPPRVRRAESRSVPSRTTPHSQAASAVGSPHIAEPAPSPRA